MTTTAVIYCLVAVLVLLIFTRLPRIIRTREWFDLISSAALALAIIMLLAVPNIYQVVDSWLGSRNLANLISHLLLYGVFWIVGIRVANALRLDAAKRFILGPINLALTALVGIATVVLFFISDLPYSSMGLLDFVSQDSVRWYLILGRVYPAIVAAILIRPTSWRTAVAVPLPLLRLSSLMTLSGLALVVLSPFFEALRPFQEWATHVENALVFGGALCVAVGSLVIWVSSLFENQRQMPVS